MRKVLIVGAGGFGREVEAHLTQLEPWTIGWVDDVDRRAQYTIENAPFEGQATIIAVGNPVLRRRLMDRARERGAVFPNFSFDGAIVRTVQRGGSGIVVCPHSIITAGVRLGVGVQVNMACVIGHDVKIGDFCTLSPSVDVMGFCEVGRDVFFGVGAKVIPNIKIGDGAIVGAGAVVIRDVPAGATVVGNPARVVVPK